VNSFGPRYFVIGSIHFCHVFLGVLTKDLQQEKLQTMTEIKTESNLQTNNKITKGPIHSTARVPIKGQDNIKSISKTTG
jgi:hypothetical protein